MARLWTVGFEIGSAAQAAASDGLSLNGATFSATKVRSGAQALKADSAAGNLAANIQRNANDTVAPVSGVTYLFRAYMLFDNLPGSTVEVTRLGATTWASARLTSAGKLQLFDDTGAAQIGSDSSETIAADGTTWHRIELSCKVVSGGGTDVFELRLNGTTVATGSANYTDSLISYAANAGWISAPGANKICYVDDMALNDDSGGSQNSYPGSGKVVLLVPTADSARGTGWVNDANAASGFFDANDNKPPAGIAQTVASTGLHQIQNATSNANSSVDLTMQTYTVAGIGSTDTINVITPCVFTGAPVVTAAKAGTVGVVSNPTIANISLGATGTSGAFWQGATAGTWAAGWKWSQGTQTYAPSVTVGTAPVMRITQVTSSTRIAMVCFMGMYVDYTPFAAAFAFPFQSQAGATLARL